MAQLKSRGRRPARGKSLLASADFTSYLREKADQLAPADLQPVLAQADAVRRRAAQIRSEHPRLNRHVELAMRLIEDHAGGQCPQIPYYTISLLTVSLLYFIDPLDVIPDWIPGAGSADDALLFELAFGLGRPGIERYCTWKGINTDGLLLPAKAARPPVKHLRKGSKGPRGRGAKGPRVRGSKGSRV
jgi:uncharacterized membrane protein YkvA (DUF1232 family)